MVRQARPGIQGREQRRQLLRRQEELEIRLLIHAATRASPAHRRIVGGSAVHPRLRVDREQPGQVQTDEGVAQRFALQVERPVVPGNAVHVAAAETREDVPYLLDGL